MDFGDWEEVLVNKSFVEAPWPEFRSPAPIAFTLDRRRSRGQLTSQQPNSSKLQIQRQTLMMMKIVIRWRAIEDTQHPPLASTLTHPDVHLSLYTSVHTHQHIGTKER